GLRRSQGRIDLRPDAVARGRRGLGTDLVPRPGVGWNKPAGLAMRPSRWSFPRSDRVVRIRMKSFGRRHRPFFRISAIPAARPRDGRAMEELGHSAPMVRNKGARRALNVTRIRYWLSAGAHPSEKVQVLLNKHGGKKPAPGEPGQVPGAPVPAPAAAPAAPP